MQTYLVVGLSGWFASIAIAMVALLPYLLRRSALSVRLGVAIARDQPYLRRMWPHYWLAYAATGLSFLHAWVLMSRGRMPRTSSLGLYLATLALVLLFVQIVVGLSLQQPAVAGRSALRQWHFWTMAEVVALVGAHIVLNG